MIIHINSRIADFSMTNRLTGRVGQYCPRIAVYAHKHCISASDIYCVFQLHINTKRRQGRLR